jgi:hypothetical protein
MHEVVVGQLWAVPRATGPVDAAAFSQWTDKGWKGADGFAVLLLFLNCRGVALESKPPRYQIKDQTGLQ